MRLRISHTTSYHYNAPVPFALQQLRKTPRSFASQSILDWRIALQGAREELSFTDQHGNHVILTSIEPDSQDVSILVEGEVETHDTHGVLVEEGLHAPFWYYLRNTPSTAPGAELRKLLKSLDAKYDGDIARLHALSELIGNRVAYEPGKTEVTTTAEDALKAGHGVCQDHTHIMIAAARVLGYSSRYVSGYLMMNDRVQQDAAHAWAEIHVPDIGWIGFDVSNGISPDERYVRVACGLDYKEAAPVSGLRFGSSAESLSVNLQVEQQ
ncbi:transglutaminase family protein [Nisaea sediminum]|uniref:transglutaminase family protein n=1 Tax=Nisaea sediminum TaxID=2775867 RepID=UPI001866C2A7|nr:transglutaminase family protein [Nisaea sediminum]